MKHITRSRLFILLPALMIIAMMVLAGCGGTGSSGNGVSGSGGIPTSTTARYAYVTNFGDGNVGQINLSDNSYKSVEATAEGGTDKPITVQTGCWGLSVEPKANVLMVSNRTNNNLSMVNIYNAVEVAYLAVGSNPQGVKYSPIFDSFAAIANNGDGTVSFFNAKIGNIDNVVSIGGKPVQLTITPDGNKVFVTNENNTMTVIDSAGLTPAIATSFDNFGNGGIDIDMNGTYVYAAKSDSNLVSRINAATYGDRTTIAVGQSPWGVACNPKDASVLYVTNNGSNTVSVIDCNTATVSATISVGTQPTGVCFTPDGSKAFVCNNGSNTVSVIDTASKTVTTTVSVGNKPTCVTTLPY
jgi:YVTN family beta-propeller protein